MLAQGPPENSAETIWEKIKAIEAQIPNANMVLGTLLKLNEKDIALGTAPEGIPLLNLYFKNSLAQICKPIIADLETAGIISIREDPTTKDIRIFLNLEALTAWSPDQNPTPEHTPTPTGMQDGKVRDAIETTRRNFTE
jgi:hypothetical protein